MPFVMVLVGFLMITVGVALLLVGEVPFIAGRRISAMRSRLIGGVLVGFLPLALIVRIACNNLLEPDAVEGPVVTAFVFSFCCLLTLVILFRVLFPMRAASKPVEAVREPVKPNPFADDTTATKPVATPAWMESEPSSPSAPISKKAGSVKMAPAQKSKKPADENPFDFS